MVGFLINLIKMITLLLELRQKRDMKFCLRMIKHSRSITIKMYIKRYTCLTLKFFTSIINQSNICQLWDFFLIIEKGLEHLKYLFKIKNISMYSLL